MFRAVKEPVRFYLVKHGDHQLTWPAPLGVKIYAPQFKKYKMQMQQTITNKKVKKEESCSGTNVRAPFLTQ